MRQRTDRSMKSIVNDALCLEPGLRGKPPRAGRFKAQPHAIGFRPGIDLDGFNQLIDEIETDEIARRFAR